MAHHYHRRSLSGCSADVKKAGCPRRLLSWILVAPQDAAGLDVHFGLFAFTFQSYYTAFSIYIHLNREDIRCVTRMACVELYVRKNSVLRFSHVISYSGELFHINTRAGTYMYKTLIYVNGIVSTHNKSTKNNKVASPYTT